jgi:hypothetical protein
VNIEIIEFFEDERDDKKQVLRGTLHAYLPDLGIDLRGIVVKKRKDSWYISLPTKVGKDHESGEPVLYPVISFTDRTKTAEMINVIRTKGKEFVEKELANKKNTNESRICKT